MGEVVQMDLMGSSKSEGKSGADSLLVIGTSLRVPRINRMVREFANAGLFFFHFVMTTTSSTTTNKS